ncbi:MAG: LLM class flavin-dependent oxidoreductase [Candidatus Bathyarchaeota archaeon]|nr:LLM class flavin-dependent oxidoreductase [Candidatus Bathyarchaeota archaeon]MCX8177667.1 LLM class flavin-dependent oxidoreductase [Candidatus Bathyarchaeota archaeon]MDW8193922.1 LLM class flavin-dependent oxidoreductase [Nitrososphaerota archaeon]
MKYGISLNINESLKDIVEKSREIERLGFEYIWVADTPSQRYAPLVASMIAKETKRVKIGVGVLSPFLYSERQIANAVKTLTEIYGERFEVCIGPGDVDQLRRIGIDLLGAGSIPKHMLESKSRIDAALKEYGLRTPIWLGAQGQRIIKISKFFHGVLLNYAHPTLIKWAVEVIRAVGGEKVKLGVYAPSYVYAGEEEENISKLLALAASTVVLGSSESTMKRIGLREEILRARAKLREGLPLEEAMRLLPGELLENFSIHMSACKLKNYLSKLKDMGIEHIVFGFPQNFSNKIIRELAEALF